MKTLISIFLIAGVLSCTKKKDEPVPEPELSNQQRVAEVLDTTTSPSCIYRIKNRPDSLLPGMTKGRVDSLKVMLDKNNISYNNLQLRYFSESPKVAAEKRFHLSFMQFINGLIVFGDFALFHFKQSDSVLVFETGRIKTMDIDSIPLLKEQEVVKIFTTALKNDKSGLFSKDDIPKACYKLELGYFDLYAGTGIPAKKYERCWKISTLIGPFGVRPSAYINDVTSSIISYSSGVID